MLIKFLLYIIMKKKEKPEISNNALEILDKNNYTPLEEWKANNNKELQQ